MHCAAKSFIRVVAHSALSLSLQRQREAAELALNGGEGQQKEIEEPEEEM